jgi:NAD(P)-dependent dehydrogenase (short-subunit alcohol dehydrogenase family)
MMQSLISTEVWHYRLCGEQRWGCWTARPIRTAFISRLAERLECEFGWCLDEPKADIRQMLMQTPGDSYRTGRGVIVNMSSMYGLIGTSMNTPAVAYTTSKHAVIVWITTRLKCIS